MSGDGKQGDAEWPLPLRPSSTLRKRPLEAAYHIGGFCEILGVPEVLGLMSTSASEHYSSPQAGSLSVECS